MLTVIKRIKKIFAAFLLLFLFLACTAFSQSISEKYLHNKTATYKEAIDFYKQLDSKYEKAKLFKYGPTDSGKTIASVCNFPRCRF
jgi:hypothetical protein